MSFIYPRTTILPLVGLTIALSCIFSLSRIEPGALNPPSAQYPT